MSAQQITAEEREIMRMAYVFLERNCCPPPNDAPDAIDWWTRTADEVGMLCAHFNSHPLMINQLTAIYTYLEQKAKEATDAAVSS